MNLHEAPPRIRRALPIKGFIEVSLIDFPFGQPGAVVFLAGCDARCGYCQASHMVANAGRIPSIPLEAVLEALEDLQGFVKGVTVTGGEVSLYPSLPEMLLDPLRRLRLAVKIDTYGARPERIDTWLENGFIQYLAVDLKGPWDRYPDIIGRRLSANQLNGIRSWIRRIAEPRFRIPCEFRTTVHPDLLSRGEIVDTARQIEGAAVYVLQNYKPVPGFNPDLQSRSGYAAETLRELACEIRQRGIVGRCFVRGFEQDDPATEVSRCAS